KQISSKGNSVAEQPETPKVLDELSRSNSARPVGRTERQKRTALRRIAIILVFISPFLLVIVFLAWQQWSLRSEMRRLADANAALNSEISSDTSRMQQLEALLREQSTPPPGNEIEISQLQATFNSEIERLNVTIDELRDQLAQAQADAGTYHGMAEVEYLVRTANQRLQIEKDVPTAVLLLQSADEILAGMTDGSGFSIREAVSRELALLESIEVVNTEELYLRISGTIARIESLPQDRLVLPDFQDRLDSAAASIQSTPAGSGFVNAGLEFLGSIFIWRHWDQTADLRIHPEQQLYLKQSLTLMMEQAQLAALRRQSVVYQTSLQQCLAQLQNLSAPDQGQIGSLVTEIQQLIAVDLEPEIPDVATLLDLVRQPGSISTR
ncbi:MAG: uroporphyrinogen-III C-methyltransferase, partial [Pseudohongiellaceae bacterium]